MYTCHYNSCLLYTGVVSTSLSQSLGIYLPKNIAQEAWLGLLFLFGSCHLVENKTYQHILLFSIFILQSCKLSLQLSNLPLHHFSCFNNHVFIKRGIIWWVMGYLKVAAFKTRMNYLTITLQKIKSCASVWKWLIIVQIPFNYTCHKGLKSHLG